MGDDLASRPKAFKSYSGPSYPPRVLSGVWSVGCGWAEQACGERASAVGAFRPKADDCAHSLFARVAHVASLKCRLRVPMLLRRGKETPLGHRRAPSCSATPHGNALLSRACFFSVAAFFTGSEVPRGRATTMP